MGIHHILITGSRQRSEIGRHIERSLRKPSDPRSEDARNETRTAEGAEVVALRSAWMVRPDSIRRSIEFGSTGGVLSAYLTRLHLYYEAP